MISDILFFIFHPITLVGLIISFFLWRKGKKRGAILAVPTLWAVLFGVAAVGISIYNRSIDLNRKEHIILDHQVEVNINTIDTQIHFTKFIKRNEEWQYLMANVQIDPNLTDTIIRVDCMKLKFFGQPVSRAHTYFPSYLNKGVAPLMPANPESNYPIVWRTQNIEVDDLKPSIISQNIDITIDNFEPCHQ